MKHFIDGDQVAVVYESFEDLQESPVVFYDRNSRIGGIIEHCGISGLSEKDFTAVAARLHKEGVNVVKRGYEGSFGCTCGIEILHTIIKTENPVSPTILRSFTSRKTTYIKIIFLLEQAISANLTLFVKDWIKKPDFRTIINVNAKGVVTLTIETNSEKFAILDRGSTDVRGRHYTSKIQRIYAPLIVQALETITRNFMNKHTGCTCNGSSI